MLGYPRLDVRWENHPSHFWLVLAVAGVNAAIGFGMSEAALRRGDARIFLVGLAFLTSAGFLGLHALATPGVLLDKGNAGFTIATPIGLLVSSALAVCSSLDLTGRFGDWIVRWQRTLRAALLLLLVGWGIASLASLPPLDSTVTPDEAQGELGLVALIGVALYGYAALRYRALYARTREPLPLAVLTAWVLLAEAMIAIPWGRNWQLSWWEWHILMAIAFALVATVVGSSSSAAVQAGRSRRSTSTRRSPERTPRTRTRSRQVVEQRAQADDVARRFGLSGEQAELVERAAGRIRELDAAFRPHLSPQVAERVEREGAELGGKEREVSVLFADLEGFTSYAETRSPEEVIAMLNEYWGTAVPVVLERHGG